MTTKVSFTFGKQIQRKKKQRRWNNLEMGTKKTLKKKPEPLTRYTKYCQEVNKTILVLILNHL